MISLHYTGLDVHKETIDVLVFREDEQRVFLERRIPNRITSIRKLFGKLLEEGSVIACYEAGCMGFELQRLLEGMGITSIVASPGRVPKRPTDRVKTDRRDARRLAEQLRAGTLEAIHIPSRDDEAVRDYLRAREDVRLGPVKTKQRLQKFLLRHGYVYESTRYWTRLRCTTSRVSPRSVGVSYHVVIKKSALQPGLCYNLGNHKKRRTDHVKHHYMRNGCT
jgi:transposase